MISQTLRSANCSNYGVWLHFYNCPFNDTKCAFYNCSNRFLTTSDPTLITSNLSDSQEIENVVDKELEVFREQSRFWVQRVLVPMILIIGLIGNTVTIVIMTRRRMRSSTNSYLAALAIFDMLYLICVFVLSLAHYPGIQDPHYFIYWHIRPFAIMLTDACSNTSVWLTVTFTIERYIAVCHPIRGKVFCTETRAKKVIVFVSLICFFLTLPTPFEWTVVEITDDKTNETKMTMNFSDFGNNNIYKTVYYTMTAILFIFIPLFLLSIFNSFLIRSVHLSKIQRNTMTRQRETRDSLQQENRITVMLIAVVLLFFICQLPTAAILVYTSLHTVYPHTNKEALLLGLGNIFNFLVCINAAGNFILYCLLSQKYRRTFLLAFCPCIKSKLVGLQSVYQRTTYSNANESPQWSRNTMLLRPKLSKLVSRHRPILSESFREIQMHKEDFLGASCKKIWRSGGNNYLEVFQLKSTEFHDYEDEQPKQEMFSTGFNEHWQQMSSSQSENKASSVDSTTRIQPYNDFVITVTPDGELSVNVESSV
ncbi:sex peptide receptor-like [Limulus polyphemus]|uniref:Sex peptide receptor-like n=1 Tax=Limulus polyphemus TaxID=6850 RepID=A0ABM1AZQ6_LIMPO|nr:sex peptide receptor-like [Limulus polyphemus]